MISADNYSYIFSIFLICIPNLKLCVLKYFYQSFMSVVTHRYLNLGLVSIKPNLQEFKLFY